MRVLKSICRKNKLFLFFCFVISGRKSAGYLFICLFFPLLSSCVILWPFHADRDYSLTEDERRKVRDIDRSDVLSLLDLSLSRYLELKGVGGEFCLPGQMEIIKEQHRLAIHEVDGDLLGDAIYTLSESIQALDKVRIMMEEIAEDGGCPLQYAAGLIQKDRKQLRSIDSVLGLSDWPRPISLKAFMRESR